MLSLSQAATLSIYVPGRHSKQTVIVWNHCAAVGSYSKNLPRNHLIAGSESKSRGLAMKRTAALLLITFVLSFSAAAQAAKTRRPALPPDLAAVAGQDSDSLLRNPVIKARMKKLLRNKYDSFMESFETLTPVKREGNFLFASGCLIHACTHLESAIAIDIAGKTIHAAIFRQDEKTKYFNEAGKATPDVIEAWADNLRQLNNPTNSSESERSFTTPHAAVAPVAPSRPRRLRGPATVRGFIGGESHDGYVIRARKGRVLTVSLSWRREDDNRASFTVSESPDFYTGELAKFGDEDDDGKRWVGRIPKSGDYYVYVVAHPSARYTLRVSVR